MGAKPRVNAEPSAMASGAFAAFAAFPDDIRPTLLAMRRLIFETAEKTEGVGGIRETLKWGQPSYLTHESKSGTTIRLGVSDARPGQAALYVHCQTTLISQFREWFDEALEFEGNRALFVHAGRLPREVLTQCIAAALTYHRGDGKRRTRS